VAYSVPGLFLSLAAVVPVFGAVSGPGRMLAAMEPADRKKQLAA
jgi:hypothetical protein